jgi:hypothetical protein
MIAMMKMKKRLTNGTEIFIEEEYKNLEPRPPPPLYRPPKAIIVSNPDECCPWDENVCAVAAMTNNLALLKWARINGCNWDNKVLVYASQNRNYNVLQWALNHGCDWGDITVEDMNYPTNSTRISEMNLQRCCAT